MKLARSFFAAAVAATLFVAVPSLAADYGTAAEAEALLTRAIAEATADPTASLAKFNDPNGEYRDRDLYVFCASTTDGKLTAHPSLVGTDLRTLKDKNDKPFGAEMLDSAQEGTITEVTYMWPRPDAVDPVEKVSRITRIGQQICGVGYYKE